MLFFEFQLDLLLQAVERQPQDSPRVRRAVGEPLLADLLKYSSLATVPLDAALFEFRFILYLSNVFS